MYNEYPLANSFLIGSDPEFVLVSPHNDKPIDAISLDLRPGLAAGADQNLCLAELRPVPSRSAVIHVAAIYATLKWMYLCRHQTRKHEWRSGAFYKGHAMGGHIHFGFYKENLQIEVDALDKLAMIFETLAVVPLHEYKNRRKGVGGRVYGNSGDIRLQPHGFEYRTFPSWLANPKKAFLVLASSKCAIMHPEILSSYDMRQQRPREAMEYLRLLANQCSQVDSDGAILSSLLRDPNNFFPALNSWQKDFRGAWGFTTTYESRGYCSIEHIPRVIPPDEEDVDQMVENILSNRPLSFRLGKPTFQTLLPPGYRWAYPSVKIPVRHGVGEIMHDIVVHEETPIKFSFGDIHEISSNLCSSSTFMRWIKSKQYLPFQINGRSKSTIIFSRRESQPKRIEATRRFLLDRGFFPMWRANEVCHDSYVKWMTNERTKPICEPELTSNHNQQLDRTITDNNMSNSQSTLICLAPDNFSASIIEEFTNMLISAKQVSTDHLDERILNSYFLAVGFDHQNKVRATAALKQPSRSRTKSVFLRAGIDHLSEDYTLELGWIVVDDKYRRQGIATNMIKKLLNLNKTRSVYATTRASNDQIARILSAIGFSVTGPPFTLIKGGNNLLLWILNK